jgi:hypothetical protein
MTTISKYAISAALMLTMASGLAFAQQSDTPPPQNDQKTANACSDNGPDGADDNCNDGGGRHHKGKRHGEGRDGHGKHGGRMMIIDANSDGFIGPDEAAALADGMFMRMDKNRDNAIDEAEATQGPGQGGWRKWMGQQQPAEVEAKLKAAFAARDTNKDAKVTKEEFMTFAQGKYAALDTAKDGKVSPWAFRAQPKL